jgi:hypothetical protein
MKNLIFCLSLFFSFLIGQILYASQVHILLAVDSITSLKKSLSCDLRHMKNECSKLSGILGVPVQTTEMSGKMLTHQNVLNWIKTRPLKDDDAILVYFTGHGVRTKYSTSQWPSFYLPAQDEIVDSQIYIDELKEIQCRLRILIADCCNVYVHLPKFPMLYSPPHIAGSMTCEDLKKRGYKTLFLQSQGLIIASGAVPGKRSWATPKGSIFTNAFLTSLRHEVDEDNPSWENVFDKTLYLCHKYQKPQYEIDSN